MIYDIVKSFQLNYLVKNNTIYRVGVIIIFRIEISEIWFFTLNVYFFLVLLNTI